MYWHAKLILGGIILMLVAITLYLGRSCLPDVGALFARNAPRDEQRPAPGPGPSDPAPEPDDGRGTPPQPPPPPDPKTAAVLEKLELARKQFRSDAPIKARQLAENVLADPELTRYGDAWRAALKVLTDINRTFLFTDAPCPEKETYLVQKGDSLWEIARKQGTTMRMVARGNGLDLAKPHIYPGQALKIYRAYWNIHVSKKHHTLLLLDGERLVLGYKVGIGRQDRTPTGRFRIDNRQEKPTWTPPGRRYEYGHPENVLGTHWLGLKPVEGTNPQLAGYGIHGTWEDDTIGGNASNGCIRMRNKEVGELFDIVPVGTPVTIVE